MIDTLSSVLHCHSFCAYVIVAHTNRWHAAPSWLPAKVPCAIYSHQSLKITIVKNEIWNMWLLITSSIYLTGSGLLIWASRQSLETRFNPSLYLLWYMLKQGGFEKYSQDRLSPIGTFTWCSPSISSPFLHIASIVRRVKTGLKKYENESCWFFYNLTLKCFHSLTHVQLLLILAAAGRLSLRRTVFYNYDLKLVSFFFNIIS